MIVQQVALPPLPEHAEVAQDAVVAVLQRMTGSQGTLRSTLERGFRDLEAFQPDLAGYLSDELAELEHPSAQTLSYFLFVLVYLAFEHSFGHRMARVHVEDIESTFTRLVADGELRHSGVARDSYSEDVVAMGQPALMRLLRSEIDRAIEDVPDNAAWKSVDPLYEALLVQILVLTNAVMPVQ